LITNPKIERKKSEIARTEANLAEIREKLRNKKHELTDLEDAEIAAMFRREIITEDDFAALMRARREAELNGGDGSSDEEISTKQTVTVKEEKPDALSEN
jgi:hypothetical protein